MRDVIWRNLFMIVVLGVGIYMTAMWTAGEIEYGLFGVSFLIAGTVGAYMTVTTRNTWELIYERLDETNAILSSHTALLQEISSSLKEIVSTQQEIVSTQQEIVSTQQEIVSTQKEISSTLKEIVSTQKEISSTLKDISNKLDK